ncbi:MAG: hypothetical protein AAF984_07025 [Verrucomicrobiota bacterium]
MSEPENTTPPPQPDDQSEASSGAQKDSSPALKVSTPNSGLAALLNLLWPGSAYFYIGQESKAVFLILLTFVILILGTLLSIVTCGILLWPIAIIGTSYWILTIIDAILLCTRLEKGEQLDPWKFF